MVEESQPYSWTMAATVWLFALLMAVICLAIRLYNYSSDSIALGRELFFWMSLLFWALLSLSVGLGISATLEATWTSVRKRRNPGFDPLESIAIGLCSVLATLLSLWLFVEVPLWMSLRHLNVHLAYGWQALISLNGTEVLLWLYSRFVMDASRKGAE